MKATSSDVKLKGTEPPQYATKIGGRKPELKYQRRGHAKVALKNKMGSNHRYDGTYYVQKDMYLFKYDPAIEEYRLIWDGYSEMAEACRRGDITPDQLLDMIEW